MILNMPNSLDGWLLKTHTETPIEDGKIDVYIVYITIRGEEASLRFKIAPGAEKMPLQLTERAIANVRRTIEALEAARAMNPCDPCPKEGQDNGRRAGR